MTGTPGNADDLPCVDVVELVTDYLEGALAPDEVGRFELHLAECDACQVYVEQVRETVRLTGRLSAEEVPPAVRDALVARFRDVRSTRPG